MIELANAKVKKRKDTSERDLKSIIEDSTKYSPQETGECPICSTYIADKLVNNCIRFITRAEIRSTSSNKLESIINNTFVKFLKEIDFAKKEQEEIGKHFLNDFRKKIRYL